MRGRMEDDKSIGIYCIYNKINGKRYIGKSVNIRKRIIAHKSNLNLKKSKSSNSYLINAWNKYGIDNFDYVVLEKFNEVNEKVLKERELYWMDFYNTCENEFGYNLRRDSSTGMITHETTRKKMSETHSKRYESLEERRKTGERFKKFWAENPEAKEQMKNKLKQIHSKYEFHQLDKETSELIKIWNSISEVMDANPTYKKHNIYAVCSGEKPSMYGYKWKKYLKKV